MQVWTILYVARWKYRMQKLRKNRHLRTIAQGCRTICSQQGMYRQSEKKLVKHQYVVHMSPQYGELRPTNGWDPLVSLGHPSKFQRVSRLGFVTAAKSLNGGQPNFARCEAVFWAGRPTQHRPPPIFGRAAITLGIGPNSSLQSQIGAQHIQLFEQASATAVFSDYVRPRHKAFIRLTIVLAQLERWHKLITTRSDDARLRSAVKHIATRQFARPMSNGMAALSREDTTPQSSADAHCSSAARSNAANVG